MTSVQERAGPIVVKAWVTQVIEVKEEGTFFYELNNDLSAHGLGTPPLEEGQFVEVALVKDNPRGLVRYRHEWLFEARILSAESGSPLRPPATSSSLPGGVGA